MASNIRFYARKSISSNAGKKHRLIGDVIIHFGQDTLYGERAELDIEKGIFNIDGNVRLVSKEVTIYGSSIHYDHKSNELILKNSRLVTDQFNLIATEIKRINKDEYIATKAEYSTCKDCPESWLLSGDKVHITLKNYVKIWNGFIYSNGVPLMYFPYFVFPIKDERETGLLSPVISSEQVSEGFEILLPWFWAISKNKDLTISPSYWGRRGFGFDLQYREAFSQFSWLEANTRFIHDQIYTPINKAEKQYRIMGGIESHIQPKVNLWAHLNYFDSRDLDILHDFSFHTDQNMSTNSFGGDLTLHYEKSNTFLELETLARKNVLNPEPERWDNSYVQIFPSFQLNRRFSNIWRGLDIDLNLAGTRFIQGEENEINYLRNYKRGVFSLDFSKNIIKHKNFHYDLSWRPEYKVYEFNDSNEDAFHTHSSLIKNSFKWSWSKTYGKALVQKIRTLNDGSEKKDSQILGVIPDYEKNEEDVIKSRYKSSLRHQFDFQLDHYFISHLKSWGNSRFLNQIENNIGLADYLDAPLDKEFLIGGGDVLTQINPSNTFDFQFNNYFTQKTPYLKNDQLKFRYSNKGRVRLAQSLNMNNNIDSVNDRLGRLLLEAQLRMANWSFNLKEYYLNRTDENIFNLYAQYRKPLWRISSGINLYDVDNKLETIYVDAQLQLLDEYLFRTRQEFDLEDNERIRSLYELQYRPNNDCWALLFNYRDTIVDQRFSFNFALNFSGGELNFFNER